jgi:succinate dehydrogenase / fumarate reductase cytochrome b subunit
VLVYWLAAAAAGPQRYAAAQAALGSLPVQLLLAGGMFSFCYHLLNGIRHLFWDAGYGFELPVARKSGLAVAVAALVAAPLLWFLLRSTLGGAP